MNVERDARITEALTAGPMSATDITRQIFGVTTRSHVARVTQSLLVMERDGIVTREEREERTSRTIDWRLSPPAVVSRPASVDRWSSAT